MEHGYRRKCLGSVCAAGRHLSCSGAAPSCGGAMKHYEVSGAGPGPWLPQTAQSPSGPRDPLLWPGSSPMAQAQCARGLLVNLIAHVQEGIFFATPAFCGGIPFLKSLAGPGRSLQLPCSILGGPRGRCSEVQCGAVVLGASNFLAQSLHGISARGSGRGSAAGLPLPTFAPTLRS